MTVSDEEVAADLRQLIQEGRARVTMSRPIQIEGRAAREMTIVVSEGWLLACTGAAADWCPVCGTCTCPSTVARGTEAVAGCPLHDEHSRHAAR